MVRLATLNPIPSIFTLELSASRPTHHRQPVLGTIYTTSKAKMGEAARGAHSWFQSFAALSFAATERRYSSYGTLLLLLRHRVRRIHIGYQPTLRSNPTPRAALATRRCPCFLKPR
jgi:hypothetical protein